MLTYKHILTICFLVLFGFVANTTSFSQDEETFVIGESHYLNKLDKRLRDGDKSALFKIAPYFDSTRRTLESLGYHLLNTPQSEIAKRIIDENCSFTDEEITINEFTTARDFLNFLNANNDKIVFSKQTDAFIITPFDKRSVNFQHRELTVFDKKYLKDSMIALLNRDWVRSSGVDSLIKAKDPACLLVIASELYKRRNRFNEYGFQENEFLDLIKLLTGSEIALQNEKKEYIWNLENDFSSMLKLNLLCYFANFSKDYLWDDELSIFTNPNVVARPLEKEEFLFKMLLNENDSIAFNSFIELTTSPVFIVNKLAEEYERDFFLDENNSIPTFPYSFLRELSLLTEYCKTHDLDYLGSEKLRDYIKKLNDDLSFEERYKLENEIIDSLSLEDVTAFEYWSLINEQSWGITYSAGRILDKFYSKNWNELLNNKKHFENYLKKSKLFDEIGIIGVCNNYLVKFSSSNSELIKLLKSYKTDDTDVAEQIWKIISLNESKPTNKKVKDLNLDGNDGKYGVDDLKKRLINLTTNILDTNKNLNQIERLLSRISYKQIPVAIKSIEFYPFRTWNKYDFLASDFGMDIIDFENKEIRNEFLILHSTKSEYELYSYYLDKAGVIYKNSDQTLDYDKMYDMLKYDIVKAFSGGGGGAKNRQVYLLVKLLEIDQNTTLKFPGKLCISQGIYGCTAFDNAKAWMKYLENKKLLKFNHNDPPSFNLEEN